MLALLPILLFAAQGAAPAGDDAPQGRPQVFIAPSGEPFRAYGEVPYPIADWFSGADKNADGKLDPGEFSADFLRFFDALDVNHDNAIDSIEKTRYEAEVAPETLGGAWTGARERDANKDWASKFGGDVNLPSVARPKRNNGRVPTGAARFDLLGLPEPVAAMDLELRGRISRGAAGEVAQMRFNQLDTLHRGYLTLDTLPETPVESRGRR
jgi:hypothetical protein